MALLGPGFVLAFLLPLLGVVAMLIGGVLLAIALEDDLVAADQQAQTTRMASRTRVA